MSVIPLNIERELHFRRAGRMQIGKLFISHLKFETERHAWACYWSLDFIKPELHHFATGRDPLESLASALCMAHELVRKCNSPEQQIWWREIGDCGGLVNFVADQAMRESKAL